MSVEIMRPTLPKKFVETSVSRMIHDRIDVAIAGQCACVVRGPAGIGKSASLAAIAESQERIYAFEIRHDNKSLGDIVETLLRVFEIPYYERGVGKKLDRVFWWLRNFRKPPCLIVDEAQNAGAAGVRTLLSLNEHAGLPLVLCGNRAAIVQTRANASIFDQIDDRVDIWLNLDKPTRDDIQRIAIEHGVDGIDAYRLLEDIGISISIRRVVKLLEIARDIVGPSGPIRIDHIKTALEFSNLKEKKELSLFKREG